jgi:hypothetical protein
MNERRGTDAYLSGQQKSIIPTRNEYQRERATLEQTSKRSLIGNNLAKLKIELSSYSDE